MLELLIAKASILLAVSAGIWLIYRFVYNVFFHPLHKIPGPLLAKATNLYEAYYEALKAPGGQYVYEIDRQHHVYGPIVRISPREVHVRDLDFIDVLYAFNSKRDKDPHHTQIFGTPLSLFGSELQDDHRPRRLAINPYFSRNSVLRLESMVSGKVQKLCEAISKFGEQNRPINARDAMVAVTVDIVTEYSFPETAGALDSSDLSPYWEKMMSGVTEAVPMARAIPGIVQVLQMLPLPVIKKMNPLIGAFFEYGNVIRSQVQDAIRRTSSPDYEKTGTRSNIFDEILVSDLNPADKAEERLTQEGIGLISAASETTSMAIASTIFYILDTPGLALELRSALLEAMPEPDSTPDWQTLERVPLLNAIIKEGLRLATPICGRLPLIAHEDLHFNNHVLPAGTVISMSPRDALLDPTIFHNPTVFNPHRWLADSSPDLKKLMDRSYLPFSKGPRMCPGFNLAYSDIYHNIAALFRRFDLELHDTIRARDVDMVRDHFVAKPLRESKGIHFRVVRDLAKA